MAIGNTCCFNRVDVILEYINETFPFDIYIFSLFSSSILVIREREILFVDSHSKKDIPFYVFLLFDVSYLNICAILKNIKREVRGQTITDCPLEGHWT